MIKHIKSPSLIKAAGIGNKKIEEFFGRINSGNSEISIAKMVSPQGWIEPTQCPEFDEFTIVLKGKLLVSSMNIEYLVSEGEAILTGKGEKVQYSTPFIGGAEYIAICLPAFSNDLVNRE